MKCKIDLTKSLDVDNYSLTMGNRVIFKSPFINIDVKDGGKDTSYEVENYKNESIETIFQSFLDSFLITNDGDFKNNYLFTHSLIKGIENGDIEIIGDRHKFNSLMNRIVEYEKKESNFLFLLGGLYTYISNKKININVADIKLKHTDNKISIIFSKHDSFNKQERVEYNIGDTTVKLYWKTPETGKESVVHDDVSLYISKVKFKEVEKELNDLFLFETPVEFEQPDLSNIAQEISEFGALMRSFLSVGVRNNNFENAEAFRYTYNNGVLLNYSPKERIFIGREFGLITIYNEETKGSRTVSISDENTWKNINKPELSEPLIAIHYMANELNRGTLRRRNILLDYVFNLKEYLIKRLDLQNEFLGDVLLTFGRVDDKEFFFKLTFDEEKYIKFTYNGLLKADFYKGVELIEGIFINSSVLLRSNILPYVDKHNSNNDVFKTFSTKITTFQKYLNILNKYK